MKKIAYLLLAVFACQYLTAQSNLTIDTIPNTPPDSTEQAMSLIGQPNNLGGGHDVTLFAGGTSRFEAKTGAVSYSWSPSTGLSDTTISNPFVTVNTTTTYTVRIQTSTDTTYYTVRAVVITPDATSAASCSNWVTNGDFESHAGCTNSISNLNWQTNWYNAGGSCDFYTACNTTYTCSPFGFYVYSYNYVTYPFNVMGNQTSSLYGNSYAGIIATSYANNYPYFEYTQSVLPCSLVTGQKYKMQFDASWASQSNFYCGNIGMLVTTNAIQANPGGSQIVATPQVDGTCGIDTHWTTFSNTYTGSGEQYVTIGNFDAAQNVCARLAYNTFPEPPLTIANPPDDYTYNFIDNIIITPITPIVSLQHNGGVYCAGIPTTFTLQETGSPGNICTWSGPYGFNATGSIVHGTVPSVAGTYVYTVTVNLGASCNLCGNLTNTISLVVLPTVAGGSTLTVTAPLTPVCADPISGLGTVFLQANGGGNAPGSYIWDPNVNVYQNTSHSHAFASVPTGVYSYSVTIASLSAGYCTDMGSTTFTVDPAPTFSLSSSSPTICKYQTSTTLTASDPSLTYTWTPAAGLNTTNGTSVVANPTVTTVYYATATNTLTGCTSKTNSITVTVTGPSSINIIASPTLCIGSTETVTLHPPANATVGYTVTPLGIIIPPTNTVTSFTFAPTLTTTYTVTEANQFGCLYSYPLNVTVLPLPTISVTSSTTTICPNTNFTLTASGGATSTSYTWSPSITTHTSTEVVHESATTTFTLEGKGTNGCPNSATVTVISYTAPLPPLLSQSSVCENTNNTIYVTNPVIGDTYAWTGSTGAPPVTCNPSTPACTNVSMNIGTGVPFYTVTETNGFGCTSHTQISAISAPSTSITHTNSLSYCSNNPHPIILNANSLGATFLWSTGQTTPTITVQPTVTTVYTVTETTGTYPCHGVATITVTVNQAPSVTITASSQTVCVGQNVILTASGANTPTSYTWSASHPPSLSTIHTSTVSVTPSVTTTYIVTGGGSVNGCNSTATVTVYVDQVPAPVLTGTLCSPNTSTLSVTNAGSNTYAWNPSANVSCNSTPCSMVTITNPTGVYTVTATDALGCTSHTTITTQSAPIISVTPLSSGYCESAAHAITLTASGAPSFSWSSNAGSVTTKTVSIPPLSSTDSFTVTGTNNSGCSTSAVATITVYQNPVITITPSANPICTGTNALLTGSGANTYTWSGTAGSGINGTNHNSNPVTTNNLTSNATYTLNGTDANGCKGNTVLTVTVTLPPTVTFSISTSGNCASISTICVGDPVTITASSSTAVSYTWNPGSLTGNPVTVTPSGVGNNIYTVTASDGSCTSVTTTTVVTTNCTAGLGHLPQSGAVPSGNYSAVASFTLTGNLSLSNCDVSISPSVTITVPVGKTLTINNSHLHALSNNMWQGIVVQPGGSVNVISGSLIEDAIVAIDNGGSASTVNMGSPANINVNGSIFNCNRTAIRQAFYQSTTPANYSTSDFSILGSVVTCRCGISQSAGLTPLTTYTMASGSASIANPTINDFYSVANYTSSTLKYPYAGLPAFEGVHLENDGVMGNPNPTNFVYTIGGGQLNIFDNLTYGVNAINASFSVSISAFQSPQLISNGAPLPTISVGGYGVNAVSTTPDWYNGIYANNNQFIGLIRGVQGINYYDMQVSNNTMFSQQVITPVGVVSSSVPPQGDYGMYLKSVRFINADMSSNQIANINNCIDFVIDQSSGYNGGNGEYVGPVTANTNTISDQFSSTTYNNRFVGNGIVIDNVIVPTNSTTTPPVSGLGTEISVRGNTITQAYRGILVRNQAFQITRTENNTITMQLEPTSFSNATTQYGIEHNRVAYSPSNMPAGFPTIYSNSVTGFITSADYGNQPYFEPKKGIWSNQTAQQYVTCNTVNTCGRAMEFTGSNMKTIWRLNNLNSSGQGLVLSAASGGGIIQQQGAIGDGIDNVWSGFSGSNPETYIDLSNANLSVLYVNGSISGDVPLNNYFSVGATPYQLPLGTSNLLDATTPSTTYDCSSIIAGFVSNSHPSNATLNARNANSGQNNSISSTSSSDITFMEMIAQDSIHYIGDSAQNSFINKNILYRQLKEDTTQMSGSVILQNFYTASQSTCRQLFCVIEDSLYQGGYNYASGLVSGFIPSCTIEQNYKRFYRMYINAMQNNFTSADSSDLETLASSCPLLNGSVVFQARAFHNSLYNSFKHYEDNCEQRIDNRSAKEQAQSGINKTSSILVYPNPNNGKVYITGFSADEKTTNIEITDVTGKLVYKQQNNIGNGVIELNLTFVSGVYFVRVVSASGTTQIQKIVINN